jgi:surface antigen
MNSPTLTSLVLIATVAAAGCATPPTNEQAGTVVGGVLGGALGSQVGGGTGRTVAIVAGTLIGAMIGSQVGRHMDDTDRMRAAQALEYNQTNQPSSWRNPDSGYEYTVTPTRSYESADGPCREYTTEAIIDGRPETVYGTACREPDGSWRVQG